MDEEEENEDDIEGRRQALPKRISDQRRTMASDGDKIGGVVESSGDAVFAALEVCSTSFLCTLLLSGLDCAWQLSCRCFLVAFPSVSVLHKVRTCREGLG